MIKKGGREQKKNHQIRDDEKLLAPKTWQRCMWLEIDMKYKSIFPACLRGLLLSTFIC